jgi:CheY-like chemotaxis protein
LAYASKVVFMDTILVLDDDLANLQGIADVLRSEHYDVLTASTGFQAIETGQNCGPLSLFVADMDLPNSSGTEVGLTLLTLLYPTVPVLFISGTPMVWWARRDVFNFQHFPPASVDFLEKPFDVPQLLMKVRSLIGRKAQNPN